MAVVMGAGDWGINDLVVQAQDAQTKAEAAKVAAQNAAQSVQEGTDLGPWNVATNVPALTANATPIVIGGYYYVEVAGNAPFGGSNFTVGQPFAVGDRLAKVGSQWYRRPFLITPGAEIAASGATPTSIMNRTAVKAEQLASLTTRPNTTNLFDKTRVVEGKEVYANGTIAARSDDAISDYIPVVASTTYTLSGLTLTGNSRLIAIYAADKVTLIGSTIAFFATATKTFTTGAGAAYVVFSLKGRTASITSYDTVQLEASAVPTPFVAFQDTVSKILGKPIQASSLTPNIRVSDPVADEEIANLRTVIRQLAATMTIEPGTNLFDKTRVVEGKEVYGDGTLPVRADDAISDYIAVKPNTTYTLSGLTITANSRLIVMLGADRTTRIGATIGFYATDTKTFTTGPGAAFIVFSLKGRTPGITSYDAVQLQEGNAATSYVPYQGTIIKLLGNILQAAYIRPGTKVADPGAQDEIANLRSVINQVNSLITYVRGTNLFDKTSVTEGREVYADGSLPLRSDDAISDFVPVDPSTTYTLSGLTLSPNSRIIAVYATDRITLIGSPVSFFGTNTKTFTTGAGAAYVVFSLKGRTASITSYDTVQLQAGSAATSYKAFVAPLVGKLNGIELIGKSIVTAQTTGNLFDKTRVVEGKEVYSDGTLHTRADDAVSDYIPVLASTTYTLSGLLTTPNSRIIAIYAADKTTLIGSPVSFFGTNQKTFTTGAGAAYVVFSLKGRTASITSYDTVQLEASAVPTPYRPYVISLLPDTYAVKIIAPDAIVTGEPVNPYNPVHLGYFQRNSVPRVTTGKKMTLFGDSITETSPELGGARDNWPNYIGNLNLGSISNYARSGAGYRDNTAPNDWQKIAIQIDRAIAAGESPDLIIFSAGTNDGAVNLGDYTTAMGKATLADLDRNNLYEALRYAYWKALTQWPGAIIFATTPLQYHPNYGDPLARIPAIEAIRKMAARYNVKLIDANSESGIVSDFELYQQPGRYLYDGLHPNVDGRKLLAKYYSAKITSYLVQ